MARIIGIDYGRKRCGIAVTDPLQIIVQPLGFVESEGLLDFLEDYMEKENVELIVFGEPMHYDGKHTSLFSDIQEVIKKIKKKFPLLKMDLEDEAYTSLHAKEILIMNGMKKSQRSKKGEIDKLSAVLILQQYLGHIQ